MTKAVQEMATRDQGFIEAKERLGAIIASLNERPEGIKERNELAVLEENIKNELQSWNVDVNIEVTPLQIEKVFELGTNIHLDDGVRTTADRKGHGLQRATMFALLRSWAKSLRSENTPEGAGEITARARSGSTIFAVEEPELFLHPHAQRRLSSFLREIAETPEHQVFLCTHSTHFVDLEYYRNIIAIHKDDPVRGSSARQCMEDLFSGDDIPDRKKRFQMSQWINPDRGEMFFARRAVFVEGETERVLLPYLAKRLGVYDPDVSIIDCGSKYNLPLYISIAKAFRIPYVAVHDEDPLPHPIPHDWKDVKRREKERTFGLNAEIAGSVEPPLGVVRMLSPDLEGAVGVSTNQGSKKGKALAALEYCEQLADAAIPWQLHELVQVIYGTTADPADRAVSKGA